MTIEVDKSKLEQAKLFVKHSETETTGGCLVCRGRVFQISKCVVCNNTRCVTIPRVEFYSAQQQVDYWNARTLIAECEIDELKKQLEESKNHYCYTIKAKRGNSEYTVLETMKTLADAKRYCETGTIGSIPVYSIWAHGELIATRDNGVWTFAGEEAVEEKHFYIIKTGAKSYETTLEKMLTLAAAKRYCESNSAGSVAVYSIYAHDELVATRANGVWTFAGEPAVVKSEPTQEPLAQKKEYFYLVNVWDNTSMQWKVDCSRYFDYLNDAKLYCEQVRKEKGSHYWCHVYHDGKTVARIAGSGQWDESFGHANKPQQSFAIQAIRNGHTFSLGETNSLEVAKRLCENCPWKDYVYSIYANGKSMMYLSGNTWTLASGEMMLAVKEEPPKKEPAIAYTVRVWDKSVGQWTAVFTKEFTCLQEAKTYAESVHTIDQFWSYIYPAPSTKEGRCVAYLANSETWWEEKI